MFPESAHPWLGSTNNEVRQLVVEVIIPFARRMDATFGAHLNGMTN